MLTIIEYLPDGFLEVPARQLHTVLEGPTLMHLPGHRSEPLFVSVLLHGNEDVGLLAVQALLKKYRDRSLPRALSIFVGNVAAARAGVRRLEGQPDYNRVWGMGDTAEHCMMRSVVEEMRQRGVFASVDLHNNTGHNPHYACINRLEQPFFHLATLFGRTVVYFLQPEGVQSLAFAELCPAVTLECGRVGDAHGVAHALEYVESCLRLNELPAHPIADHDIDLFHTVATVRVPPEVGFSFSDPTADILFIDDLDRLNFQELPTGTLLANVQPGSGASLEVVDEKGHDVSKRFFSVRDGEIRFAAPVMPSMLTLDEAVIRQDCLCYLMERYPL